MELANRGAGSMAEPNNVCCPAGVQFFQLGNTPASDFATPLLLHLAAQDRLVADRVEIN